MRKVKQLMPNLRKFLFLQRFFDKTYSNLSATLILKLQIFLGNPRLKLKMELVLKKKTYNLNKVFLGSYLKNPIIVWSNSFLGNLNFELKLKLLTFQDQIVSKFLTSFGAKCNESRKVLIQRCIAFTNTCLSTFFQVIL